MFEDLVHLVKLKVIERQLNTRMTFEMSKDSAHLVEVIERWLNKMSVDILRDDVCHVSVLFDAFYKLSVHL